MWCATKNIDLSTKDVLGSGRPNNSEEGYDDDCTVIVVTPLPSCWEATAKATGRECEGRRSEDGEGGGGGETGRREDEEVKDDEEKDEEQGGEQGGRRRMLRRTKRERERGTGGGGGGGEGKIREGRP